MLTTKKKTLFSETLKMLIKSIYESYIEFLRFANRLKSVFK